jgi:hypothetical protein
MQMKTRLIVILTAMLAALVAPKAQAWGNCRLTAERAAGINTAGATKIVIRAGAGDLEIRGLANTTRLEARGGACASSQALLDAIRLNVRREGDVIFVETDLPQYDLGNITMGNGDNAYLNLGVALPNNIAVEGLDSSGDATIFDVASLEFQDSSGDFTARSIAGAVSLQDSSGDLLVEDVGSARVVDSSGDIRIRGVKGDAIVVSDSSGDIRLSKVDGNAVVEVDSSGSIEAEDIGGSFTVGADGSGEISYVRVAGGVTVPD